MSRLNSDQTIYLSALGCCRGSFTSFYVFFVRLWSGFSDFCKIVQAFSWNEDNTVVSISSQDWRLTRTELSGIDERMVSQQQQWSQRTEKEQLWFPKKEYITENLVNGCWGRIILFQTDAIVGILSTQSADLKWIREEPNERHRDCWSPSRKVEIKSCN